MRACRRTGGMTTAMTRPTTVLISRRESFSAAHQLCDHDLSDAENRRLFGKCVNLHGHNYVLEVVVSGEVSETTGYLLDLKHLSDVVCRQIISDVDHPQPHTRRASLEGRGPA